MGMRAYLTLGALLVVSLAGCGSSGPATYEVSGSVSFDGEPVAKGEILFRAADGAQATAAGKIADGKYTLRTTPGRKRVEIIATRTITAETPAASGEPAVRAQMFIPAQYNTQSTLSVEVKVENASGVDFALKP